MRDDGRYWRNPVIGVVLGWGILPCTAVQGVEWSAELDLSGGGEFNDRFDSDYSVTSFCFGVSGLSRMFVCSMPRRCCKSAVGEMQNIYSILEKRGDP